MIALEAFYYKLKDFYNEFKTHKTMVLSTASDDKVTSRTMSIVLINGIFYFQTDRNFEKCRQIENNPNVSLCIDNIQIEGICREIGKPVDNSGFIKAYKNYFPNSYKMYSLLYAEVLYEIKPTLIKKWIYENSFPYIEIFDLKNNVYKKTKYQVQD